MSSYKEKQLAQWTAWVESAESNLHNAAPGDVRADREKYIKEARGLLAGIDAGHSHGKPTRRKEELLHDILTKI